MPARHTASSVTVRVPGKVNLHLSVGRLRPDGFHELTTVFQAISLYDDVTVSRSAGLSVRVEGDDADLVPDDASNLAARAVLALASRYDQDPHLDVVIRKGIPVAGGCAGGSADAAAALVACDVLWGLGLAKQDLAAVAAELGADVPFCLFGGTALGTGRGDQLTPVLGGVRTRWVLGLVEGGLSTPRVYGELDRLRETGPVAMASDPSALLSAIRQGSAIALGRVLSNDLQAAALALRPELQDLLALGRELGCLGAVVSGSGPTVAYLVDGEEQADRLARGLAGHPACRATRVADGPAPGARVLEVR